MEGGSAKEQFDLLYAKLVYYRDSAIESVFKVVGFLVLATGWIITSDKAREFVSSDPLVRWSAVTVIVFVAVTFAVIATQVTRQSLQTFEALKELNYMPVSYFQDVVANPRVAALFVATDLAISLALCIFMIRL